MRTFVLSLLLAFGLSAAAVPVVSHVTPGHAFYYGGTRVTIHGSGFGESRSDVQVFAGGEPAGVEVFTPTRLVVVVFPPGGREVAVGTHVDVRVVTKDGEVTLAKAIEFAVASSSIDNYTRFLVPFTTETIAGANGSRWAAELTIFNKSDYPAGLVGPFNDPRFLSPPHPAYVEIGPQKTGKPPLYSSGATAGAFVYVPNPLVFAVKKSQRVRDLSQNATNWGTELPFVRYEDTATIVSLSDIPTDPKYRATLRVYHWSQRGGLPAEVTIYAANRVEPIAVSVLRSTGVGFDESADEPMHPSYSQADLLTPEVRAAAAGGTIHLEINNLGYNLSPPLEHLWALVSITNNETQQVTIVTPNRY